MQVAPRAPRAHQGVKQRDGRLFVLDYSIRVGELVEQLHGVQRDVGVFVGEQRRDRLHAAVLHEVGVKLRRCGQLKQQLELGMQLHLGVQEPGGRRGGRHGAEQSGRALALAHRSGLSGYFARMSWFLEIFFSREVRSCFRRAGVSV